MIAPVFLSASEPDPRRKPEYWESRNLLNVREAVRSFCAHVLPHFPVVFGGHPAITPLVRQVAGKIAHQVDKQKDGEKARKPKLLMLQSALYVDREDSEEEIVTEAHEQDGDLAGPTGGFRNASLLRMRYEMLGGPGSRPLHPRLARFAPQLGMRRKAALGTLGFSAAVFIGGMEGVEREFHIFRSFHPDTPAFPIASTGSVCVRLLEEVASNLESAPAIFQALRHQTAYSLLMQQILPAPGARAHPPWHRDPDPSSDAGRHIDPEEIDRPRPPER